MCKLPLMRILFVLQFFTGVISISTPTSAQTATELYSKFVPGKCIEEIKGVFALATPNINEQWCKQWQMVRLLPLLEAKLRGEFDTPIGILPCNPSKGACPDPIPFRVASPWTDPGPAVEMMSFGDLPEKANAALRLEINSQQIAQTEQFASALRSTLSEVESEIKRLQDVRAKLE
jgi:hypothetical protein